MRIIKDIERMFYFIILTFRDYFLKIYLIIEEYLQYITEIFKKEIEGQMVKTKFGTERKQKGIKHHHWRLINNQIIKLRMFLVLKLLYACFTLHWHEEIY